MSFRRHAPPCVLFPRAYASDVTETEVDIPQRLCRSVCSSHVLPLLPMSNTRRTLVLVAAVTTLVAGLVIPAQAEGDTASGGACVVTTDSFNAVRASLTPTGMIEEDRAFNHDDPDAEGNPLALIRYPGETALWISARVGDNGNLMAGSDALNATAVRGDFAVPERSDTEVSDSIVRLFCALFDREPTSLELEYWAARYWNGLPLVTIAEAFT